MSMVEQPEQGGSAHAIAEEPAIILKIFSGPHAGAEVPLLPGEIILGSSAECDLVINDALVQPKHLKLTIGTDQVVAETISGQTRWGGNLLEDEQFEVPFFTFLTVGGTQIAFGIDGESWQMPEAEALLDLPAISEHQSEPGNTGGRVRRDSAFEQKSKAGKTKGIKRGRYTGWLFFLLLLFGAGLTAGWLAIAPDKTSAVPEKVQVDPIREIRKIVSGANSAGNLLVGLKEGRAIISGFVQTNAENTDLLKSLAPFGRYVSVRVFSQEKILADSKLVLDSIGLDMQVQGSIPGEVTVSGVVDSLDHWQHLRRQLPHDVAGLNKLNDDHVITAGAVLNQLHDLLMTNGFAGKLTVKQADHTFVVSGELTARQRDIWNGLKQQMEESLGFPLSIADQTRLLAINDSVQESRLAGSKIDSVTLGDLSWITLGDGSRLFKGSMVPGGFRIQEITAEGAILSKPGVPQKLVTIGDEL
jgi:type III secretion protein D